MDDFQLFLFLGAKDKSLYGGRRVRTNKGHAAEKLDNIT
jgi:hypothetical protein